jgi:hypothetical protein
LPTQQQQQHPLPFQKNEFAAVEERLYMCKMGLRRLVSLSRFDQQRLAQDIADRIEQDVVWLARGFQEEEDFEYLRIVRGPDTIPRPTVVSTTRDAESFTVIRRGVVQQPEVPDQLHSRWYSSHPLQQTVVAVFDRQSTVQLEFHLRWPLHCGFSHPEVDARAARHQWAL